MARTDQHDYVDIVPGDGGCYAVLPYRQGGGRMELGLQQDGCVVRYVVVHELLHSLGFKHEQNRPDRDDYIDMHWDNIQAGGASQFYIETWVDTEPTITEICDQSGKPAGEAGTENLMPGVTTPPL